MLCSLRRDCFHWRGLFRGLVLVFAFLFAKRPDMKTTGITPQFPKSPNPLAFAEAAIVNVVCADVGFRPVTLAVCVIKTAGNKEESYVVTSIPGNDVVSESQNKIHPMFSRARAVVVKAGPRP